MKTTIEQIQQKYKLFHAAGCSVDQVVEAEKALNLKLSDEYRRYVLDYGAISFDSYEFTGLNVDGYLNVVEVTLQERNLRSDFPQNGFVVQQLGIEGIIIVQDETGAVFEMNEAGGQHQIANSFAEYIESLL